MGLAGEHSDRYPSADWRFPDNHPHTVFEPRLARLFEAKKSVVSLPPLLKKF
jgi:hypothetical protein